MHKAETPSGIWGHASSETFETFKASQVDSPSAESRDNNQGSHAVAEMSQVTSSVLFLNCTLWKLDQSTVATGRRIAADVAATMC